MTRLGLRGQLFFAQLLVLTAGGASFAVAATAIAPSLFHAHLSRAGVDDPGVQGHVEEAFGLAASVAMSIGAVFGLAASGLISWLFIRRIIAPVDRLVAATDDIARGAYTYTPPPGVAAAEFSHLERAFTQMASRLDGTERARTRLFHDLTHELRTPVATLDAYIEGLEDDVLAADAATWTVMHDQLERLRRLADDIGELSAADEDTMRLELQTDDLNATIRAAAAAIAPRCTDHDVILIVHVPHNLPPLIHDRQRLEQVLANLLDNALRYTPAGGEITIAATRPDTEHLRISVTDTGEGIAPGHLETIFDRFHRLDPARSPGGSGLGLTIARSLVRAHGGTLTATNRSDTRGTRFEVTLPRAGRPSWRRS